MIANDVVTVTFYSDAACSTVLKTGTVTTCTPNKIDIQGVQISVGVTVGSCSGTESNLLSMVPNLKVAHK